MKKFLLIALVAALLLVVSAVIFVATFDVNRFKPMIISRIEAALGNPAQIDHLFLGFKGGISLELTGLRIYSDGQAKGEPAITVNRASALLSLAELFHRKISIGSIVIDSPSLHLLRSGDGTIHVLGFNPAQAAHAAPAPPSQTNALAAVPVLISTVRLNNGSLRFTDSTASPPSEIQIRNLDVLLDHVSFDRPVRFEARLGLLSQRQNMAVTGRFILPAGKNPGALENVRLKADLGNLNPDELARALGASGFLGLDGEAVVDLDRFVFGANGMNELSAAVQLKNGKLALPGLQNPLEHIGASISVEKDQLNIKRLSADLAGGKIEISGLVDRLSGARTSNLLCSFEGFSLKSFQSQAAAEAPRLQGTLNGSFKGAFSGLSGPEITRTLSGQIQVQVKDPIILNFNLVREVFSRLSILPRLVETLEKRLPEDYGEKLRQRDTVLQPIQVQGQIAEGVARFDHISLVSDTFILNGRLGAGFNGSVFGDAILKLDPDLSSALIRSVTELQYLTDQEGRLEIPVRIQSDGQRLAIIPDLQYVGTKLAVVKTQEVIGKWLEKKAGGKDKTTEKEPSQATTPQGDLVGSLIGGLLQSKS